MHEPRIIHANDSALRTLYSEGWRLVCVSDGKMYLEREIRVTRAQKKSVRTPEYQEFHDTYPKKAGITSDKVIRKIAELVASGEYRKVMDGVERYNKKIIAENVVPKFILNAETFLNNRRWEDPLDAFEDRVPLSHQWMIPMLRELTDVQQKEAKRMYHEWETKFGKDITPGTFSNMLERILGRA